MKEKETEANFNVAIEFQKLGKNVVNRLPDYR